MTDFIQWPQEPADIVLGIPPTADREWFDTDIWAVSPFTMCIRDGRSLFWVVLVSEDSLPSLHTVVEDNPPSTVEEFAERLPTRSLTGWHVPKHRKRFMLLHLRALVMTAYRE